MTPGAARSAVAPDGPGTLYLHIGMPKTGATWIQRALALNRAGPGREAAEAALADALARLAAGDDVVLTSETFRQLAPRKRRALLALMGKGAARLRNGETLDRIRPRPPRCRRALGPWQRGLGRNRLTLRIHDPEELTGGDALIDFLSVIGQDGADLQPPDPHPARGGGNLPPGHLLAVRAPRPRPFPLPAPRVTRSHRPARPWFPPPASIYQGTGAQETKTPSPVANVPRPVSVVRRRRHVATALFDGSAA
ncbi:hypothetical protein SAMN05444336_101769 [Albimonas donghaensis]|uniref:Uncharacterized protein n=2 Tax=Albimonas donghaensis TaxID=356660 RepID=A0A1H2STG5_9RHOB|nr:hypothetical protein SAMN05444336_101769 [Albimonas donghaensis]